MPRSQETQANLDSLKAHGCQWCCAVKHQLVLSPPPTVRRFQKGTLATAAIGAIWTRADRAFVKEL